MISVSFFLVGTVPNGHGVLTPEVHGDLRGAPGQGRAAGDVRLWGGHGGRATQDSGVG